MINTNDFVTRILYKFNLLYSKIHITEKRHHYVTSRHNIASVPTTCHVCRRSKSGGCVHVLI